MGKQPHMMSMGGGMGPPQKRMRIMDGGMMGKGAGMGMGASTGDPNKDRLVNMLKNYQRQGQQEKEMWWNHCDTTLGGVRDPARHDVSTLQDFVNTYGISEAPQAQAPPPQYWPGSDPTKDQLIAKVKAFQKQG